MQAVLAGKKHGVSDELLKEIVDDRTACYDAMATPWVMLDWRWQMERNYAFKEGVKHHEVDY